MVLELHVCGKLTLALNGRTIYFIYTALRCFTVLIVGFLLLSSLHVWLKTFRFTYIEKHVKVNYHQTICYNSSGHTTIHWPKVMKLTQ